MRVGLICPYDWTAPGGVQTQVAGLAGALGRLGHRVMVITPEGTVHWRDLTGAGGADRSRTGARVAGDPADQTTEPYRVLSAGRSIRIPANGSIAPVAPTPTAMARTVRELWRFRPDVVHVHEPLAPGPPLAAMVAGPQPIIATFHRAGPDRLYTAESRLIGAVMSRAGQSVAVSQAAAATATAALGPHLGRGDLLIVPNGVDLGIYAGAREEAARSRSREPTERLTIVFVGRHEDRKGLRVLLEAFTELPPAVRLDVLGDGPRSAELRRRFPDARISWPGAATEEAKARSLASADLFVAPSIAGESFGVVLLEAMAAGTAVVASDLPGYRLAAGEGARFVPPGDPHLLAGVLAQLLADPVERRRLVTIGDQVAAAHSMEAVARRYAELYQLVRPDGGRRGHAGTVVVPEPPVQ